ncbi:hypothetical protein JXB28_04415 [Candidatus Woesearchaeota archaeon]|nr:hypothetical protein [Candidatus Woesearchaeota archaeon]
MMRVVGLLLILVLLFSSLAFTGCGGGEEEKPIRQCERNSDCKSINKCFTPKCTADGQCTTSPKEFCCGNKICEPQSMENSCSCPDDCGQCQGAIPYNVTTGLRTVQKFTQYAIYLCENNMCVVGADQTKIRVLRMVDDIVVMSAFKAETLSILNSPFDIKREKISIEISLKDRNEKLSGPVVFTEIKVLSDTNEMMGRIFIDEKLEKVGDMFTKQLNLVSSQKVVEQDKPISWEVFYEYVKMEPDFDAPLIDGKRPSKPVLYRASTKIRLAQKPVFIAQPTASLEEESAEI